MDVRIHPKWKVYGKDPEVFVNTETGEFFRVSRCPPGEEPSLSDPTLEGVVEDLSPEPVVSNLSNWGD